MLRLGIISDTHNYLDPIIEKLFQGVDHILHAGDIGLTWLIEELKLIAPVTAVAGNTDDPGLGYPLTATARLGGRLFLLHHIVEPRALAPDLQERIVRERPDMVVFGHTHKPFAQTLGSTFFLNPGYAGKSRFGLERSVAILHCGPDVLRHEYIKL